MSRKRGASAAAVTAILAFAAPAPVQAAQRENVTFAMEAVQGDHGTSFLYMRAHDSRPVSTPAPNRRLAGCPTPYYTAWILVSRDTQWSNYVIQPRRCSDGQLVDPTRGYGIAIGNGDGTVVAGEQRLDANGVAIYTLVVSLDPATVVAGQPAVLTADVTSDFEAVADRTLNISVRPDGWSVSRWSVEFGDGERAELAGGGRSLRASHVYRQAGSLQPLVTGHVAGTAQVADWDAFTGEPFLIDEPFTIDVTNTGQGRVARAPLIAYVPPASHVAAAATLAGQATPPAAAARSIEVFRGVLTAVYVRPVVDREGYMTADGAAAGQGTSELVAWRLDWGGAGGPSGEVTTRGTWGTAGSPITLQWDRPDQRAPGGPVAYTVGITYVMRTHYPDGHDADSTSAGALAVQVRYSASGGEG